MELKSNMSKHLLTHQVEIDKNILITLFLFHKISFDLLFKVPMQCELPVSDLISALDLHFLVLEPIGPN